MGAEYQIQQWKKIKDILVEALIRKCATQLRLIYVEISKHKVHLGNITVLFPTVLTHDEKKRDYHVELQRFFVLTSLQPSFLEKCSVISKNGQSISELILADKLFSVFPDLKEHENIVQMVANLKSLYETIGGSVAFVQNLMYDITKIKQEGSVSSKIYDDLLTFIFGVKKEISSQVMKEAFQDIVKLYKTRKIGLECFLQETLSYCLLFTFGEFWDYATCLYQSGRGREINIVLLRADDKFRQYLQDFYNELVQQIFPVIIAEKNSDTLFSCFSIINEIVTLPVLPEGVDPQFGQSMQLTFETIQMLLPFQSRAIHDLFKDELFCFFYSLFKIFADQLLRDYRTHLHTFALNIFDQVFKKFDKNSFVSTHPLAIPTKADGEKYENFKKETHSSTYFRPIRVTKYLLENCWRKIGTNELQRLAYDCISLGLRHLLDCSQLFNDKFDSNLFVIKNLVDLYSFLENDFDKTGSIVTLSQVSFNPRNNNLSNLLRGRLDYETLSGVLFDVLPQMTDYSVDLKLNILKALDHMLQKNLDFFSLFVSQELVEYLGRLKSLSSKRDSWQTILNSAEKDSPQAKRAEAQLKELEEQDKTLFLPEKIKKVYEDYSKKIETSFDQMMDKVNVFADEKTAKLFNDKFLPYLVKSTTNYLHSFYVEVAKHCSQEVYKGFGFQDASIWKEQLIKKIVSRALEKQPDAPSPPLKSSPSTRATASGQRFLSPVTN